MLERKSCEDCGHETPVCPACGSPHAVEAEITTEDIAFGTSLQRAILKADDGDVIEFESVCWSCGWTKRRTVTVEVES